MGHVPDALVVFGANLALALVLGVLIGLERQWRQRLAGLQTNALVALGAAGFVGFSQLYASDPSPTRVAAQVVSGIGFLGAGVIFKDGLSVRGLNTAATLWCAAAVGVLAGAQAPLPAIMLALLVVCVNLLLNPLAGMVSRQVGAWTGAARAGAAEREFIVTLVCDRAEEARVRAVLLKQVAIAPGLRLRQLDSADIEDTARATIAARLLATGQANAALEDIVGRLSLDPAVTAARWRDEDAVLQ